MTSFGKTLANLIGTREVVRSDVPGQAPVTTIVSLVRDLHLGDTIVRPVVGPNNVTGYTTVTIIDPTPVPWLDPQGRSFVTVKGIVNDPEAGTREFIDLPYDSVNGVCQKVLAHA